MAVETLPLPTEDVHLNSFNKDVLALVVDYFTPRDIVLYSSTSKEFQEACSVDSLWQRFMKVPLEKNTNLDNIHTSKQYFQACPQYRKFEWLHVDRIGLDEVSRNVSSYFKTQREVLNETCALSQFCQQYHQHWLCFLMYSGFIEPEKADKFLAEMTEKNYKLSTIQLSKAISFASLEVVLIDKVLFEIYRLIRIIQRLKQPNGISILDIRHKNLLLTILKGMSDKDLKSMCALNEHTSIFKSQISDCEMSTSSIFPLRVVLSVRHERRNPLFLIKNPKVCELLKNVAVLYHPLIAARVLQCNQLQLQMLYFIFITKPHEEAAASNSSSSSSSSNGKPGLKGGVPNTSLGFNLTSSKTRGTTSNLKHKHVLQLLRAPPELQSMIIKDRWNINFIIKVLNHSKYETCERGPNGRRPSMSIRDLCNQVKLEKHANTRGVLFEGLSHKTAFMPSTSKKSSSKKKQTLCQPSLSLPAQRQPPQDRRQQQYEAAIKRQQEQQERQQHHLAVLERRQQEPQIEVATADVSSLLPHKESGDTSCFLPTNQIEAAHVVGNEMRCVEEAEEDISKENTNHADKKKKTMNDYFMVCKKLKVRK